MRETNRAGRKPGRRPKTGDDGPDLFAAQITAAVKQAFEEGGGSVESKALAPAISEPPPSDVGIPETPPIAVTEDRGALDQQLVDSTPDIIEAEAAKSQIDIAPSELSSEIVPASADDAKPEITNSTPATTPANEALQEGTVAAPIEAPDQSAIVNPQSAILPEPLPARMLNEFVYCPRLFYYEYVEGVFVDNADTIRGAAVHARVDKGSGAMPPANGTGRTKRAKAPNPETADKSGGVPDATSTDKEKTEAKPETIHSRSATLGSDRLGVIAKLDLVEITRRDATFDVTASEDAGKVEEAPGSVSAAATESQTADAGEGTEETDLLPVYEVQPVDYKAGSPREGENGNELWPTDRMQLGLQMLLLRENGYHCERGIIYYRGTKQRVFLELTLELETWVSSQIEAARRTIAGSIPAPLIASPKCVRCSLNSVCLPDETRLLSDASISQEGIPATAGSMPRFNNETDASPTDAPAASPDKSQAAAPPPRRLIAPRDDKRVLYLNTPGTRVGRKDEILTVKQEDRTLDEVRINDLSHVALFGNIQISTQAIQVLCELEVPITYFSMGGWFYGMTRGHQMKNIFTRMEQFRLARDPIFCLALARRLVNGKIRNHRVMLMRSHLDPPQPIVAKLKTMADSALQAQSLEELLGTEGAAASFYFSAFSGMLKAEDDFADIESPKRQQLQFNFNGRNRRPPTDPVNAMLSFAYSLLAKDCTLAAMAVGLDPYVGFYHQPRFGRPALALDLMEEFRPLIAESVVLTCINNRMILPRHFVQAGKAVNLSTEGRKIFASAFEQRMGDLIRHPIFDYQVSYRRVVELQFRLLARYLTGEIPEYPPFVTR